MTITILTGDCRAVLPTLPDGTFQTCVTSPPYFGLRSYLPDGDTDKHLEIGLEPTPEEYVAELVGVFREVRRVLRDDGTLWLNIGDSYAGSRCGPQGSFGEMADRSIASQRMMRAVDGSHSGRPGGKHKDLIGIPWMVAFALRADGWYLRRDIIWHKPNPMPESVTDRPTTSHEYVFLMAKSADYFYDMDAIAEDGVVPAGTKGGKASAARFFTNRVNSRPPEYKVYSGKRNSRSVWTIATKPYKPVNDDDSHYATMPAALAERCILAGSREGDAVLDPFGGAGTTGLAADRLGRNATLIELNPRYGAQAQARLTADAPLFVDVKA